MIEQQQLTVGDYQAAALRTANYALDSERTLTAAALGLCGESGEGYRKAPTKTGVRLEA
jgi:hypothetical protein